MSACCFSSAVQSERKPIEVVPREKHGNCAASTQKIYIRKDLNSPLIATPTFISDTEADGSRSVGNTEKPRAWAPPISLLLIVALMFAELGFHVAVHHVRSNLLDQGMLVNIQQPVIQSDGTLLLAADSKVELQLPFICLYTYAACFIYLYLFCHYLSPPAS